jgi:hypothetical protein
MQRWSFETFGSIKAEIKLLRVKLADAQNNALISGSSLEVHDVEKKLHDIFEKEEIMYKQRSRQEWLNATRTLIISKIERLTGGVRIRSATFGERMGRCATQMKE